MLILDAEVYKTMFVCVIAVRKIDFSQTPNI